MIRVLATAALLSVAAVAVISKAVPVTPPTATPAGTVSGLMVSGHARVIDGDTVVVGGTHVRLKGVDAPELGTARGDAARQVMMQIVGTSNLTCVLTGEKTWQRDVGFCTTSQGVDINQAIIARGAALACPRYDGRYLPFETTAALTAQVRSSYCVRR